MLGDWGCLTVILVDPDFMLSLPEHSAAVRAKMAKEVTRVQLIAHLAE
jgi:hypothetical protein